MVAHEHTASANLENGIGFVDGQLGLLCINSVSSTDVNSKRKCLLAYNYETNLISVRWFSSEG